MLPTDNETIGSRSKPIKCVSVCECAVHIYIDQNVSEICVRCKSK